MKYYTIKHMTEEKFIGVDRASGGYPYETDSFCSAMISSFNKCTDYLDELDKFNIDKNSYKIVLIEFINWN